VLFGQTLFADASARKGLPETSGVETFATLAYARGAFLDKLKRAYRKPPFGPALFRVVAHRCRSSKAIHRQDNPQALTKAKR
jgi:hypothetical protein